MSEETKQEVQNEAESQEATNQEPTGTTDENSKATQEASINGQVDTKGLETITELISGFHKNLRPLLIALTPKQRQHLCKIGPGRLPFVEKTLSYAKLNPEFMLPSMDKSKIANQLLVLKKLYLMQRVLKQFIRELDNTVMTLGNGVYGTALSYYQSVKTEARRNQPSAEVIYQDLKQHFAKHGPQGEVDQDDADTETVSG